VVEFDATTWNANGAGLTYAMLIRVPITGAVTPASQPAITRATGTVTLRVNLVGAQKSTATDFDFVVASESTIPANSSFGTITITILNPGVSSTTARDLVLQLVDNASIKASVNYAKVGLRISQL
jgi:hypothetical protein